MNEIDYEPKPHGKINRREFLRLLTTVGVGGLCLKAGLDHLNTDEVVQRCWTIMGTVVNLTLIAPQIALAEQAAKCCFEQMQTLVRVLNRFDSTSQVTHLNQQGKITAPHPALSDVLHLALMVSEKTNGAFDITIKPLYDLYATWNDRHGGLPPSVLIEDTLTSVGYQKVKLDKQQVEFSQPNMQITLDGVAKGYILDQSVIALRRAGIESGFLEAGGDLVAWGENSIGEPWKVGIQAPRGEPGDVIATLMLNGQAVATSGDYMQAFTPDLTQHHILDPRRGISPAELASATVVAPTCALADALATAIMVLGVERGLHLLDEYPDCVGVLVTKNGEVIRRM